MEQLDLTQADIMVLKSALRRRTKQTARTILISLALPPICLLAIVLFFDAVLHRVTKDVGAPSEIRADAHNLLILPHSWEDVEKFFTVSHLMSYLICIACVFVVIVQFFRKILPVLIDLHRQTKSCFTFAANKYSLESLGQYFIRTPLPDFPFFHVSIDVYQRLSESEILQLEFAPKSGLFLTLKYQTNGKEVPLIAV